MRAKAPDSEEVKGEARSALDSAEDAAIRTKCACCSASALVPCGLKEVPLWVEGTLLLYGWVVADIRKPETARACAQAQVYHQDMNTHTVCKGILA